VEEDEIGWASSTNGGEEKHIYCLLVGKQEGTRPIGRPRRRWVQNIKIDLGEIGWVSADWIRIGTGKGIL
jgi:hypothetical protein